jgi:hypothetical protein
MSRLFFISVKIKNKLALSRGNKIFSVVGDKETEP